MHKARFWESLGDGKVRCSLCPHSCIIVAGRSGFCKARKNIAGELYSLVYGQLVAINADPVEKKPLYHFLPGSYSLSIGTAGCNLSCMHCQNWDIARAEAGKIPAKELSPEQVVEMAIKKRCSSISYTYNEPTVFFEFAVDCARLARQKGLKNIIITNGFISEEAAEEFAQVMDAANVDLKAFSEKFYHEVCKADLPDVLRTLRLFNNRIWLEITTLLIDGYNDDPKEIDMMCQWIVKNLGDEVPLHFSRAYPMYQLNSIEPTRIGTLEAAKEIAEKYLNYAYIGNVQLPEDSNTYCPECKNLLMERDYYITEKRFEDSICPQCGTSIAGVFDGNGNQEHDVP